MNNDKGHMADGNLGTYGINTQSMEHPVLLPFEIFSFKVVSSRRRRHWITIPMSSFMSQKSQAWQIKQIKSLKLHRVQ